MRTLWLLVKIRFLSLFFSNRRNRAKKHLSIPLIVLLSLAVLYVAVVFLGLFALIFGATAPIFLSLGEPSAYFALVSLLAMGVMLLGSIIFTQSQLFEAGDNAFLLSLPIPPHLILCSRMLFLLLLNYAMQAIVFLPGFIVWLIAAPFSLGSVLLCLLSFLLLPFPTLAISCLLGWCLTKITQRIRHKQLVTLLFSLLFLGAYFFLLEKFELLMEGLGEEGLLPLLAFLQKALPFAVFGRACLGSFLHFLLVLGVSALLFGGVYYWLSKSFFKTVLSPAVHRKRAYKEKTVQRSSALWALTKKELLYLSSSAGYMMNAGIGLLFVLLVPIVFLVKGDLLLSIFAELPAILPILPVLFSLLTGLLVSMSMFSACSVSLEGKSLWIARTSPVPTKIILLSKALFHFLPCAVASALSWVLYLILLAPPFPMAVLMLLYTLAFSATSALAGLMLNLLFPKLEWNNLTVPVKQGLSVLLSMLVNGFLAFILLAGGFILSILLPPLLVLSLITLFVLGLGALLWLWTRTRGVRRFEALL